MEWTRNEDVHRHTDHRRADCDSGCALLDEAYDVKKLTSWGFEWTYEGAEPQQLALAILADHFGNGEKAIAHCEQFMRDVVANMDNDWILTSDDIDKALGDNA